jgi:hypothetical protein
VVFGKTEICPAVLERKAAALGDNACAEAAVIAVDKGYGVALGVGAAEVHSVTLQMCWRAMDGSGDYLLRIEELCALGQILFGDKFCRWYFLDVGICNEPMRV